MHRAQSQLRAHRDAREAEAFGFPAEVFRMTQPVPALAAAPATPHRRQPRDLVDRTVRSAQAAHAAWRR